MFYLSNLYTKTKSKAYVLKINQQYRLPSYQDTNGSTYTHTNTHTTTHPPTHPHTN